MEPLKVKLKVTTKYFNTRCVICGKPTETGGVEWSFGGPEIICAQCRKLDPERWKIHFAERARELHEAAAEYEAYAGAEIIAPTENERMRAADEYEELMSPYRHGSRR